MQLTISGYSTALFATWYFVEELGLLFDAGDGVSAALLQKSRKINHVFVSHADRDHLTGLVQLNQLNARPGYPVVYYPKNCASFPALDSFAQKFDPHVAGTVWQPLTVPAEIPIKDDIVVVPVINGHVPATPGTIKSLSYQVFQLKQKLKPEYIHLPGQEIKKLMETLGKETLTTEIRTPLVHYSGDTPVEDWDRWNNAAILIHEATFIDGDEPHKVNTHKHKHSTLNEVLEMVANIRVEKLVLGHFSSRYSAEHIDDAIRRLCRHYQVRIPVYRLLPGQTHFNILNGSPLNS
ncbi:RNAse Z [Filimonas lacunae]|uniref:RNAse Z n=1 Tax=Filimonas lacunae TaxID=477680 RepID=A0A173MFK6_9BACT|nr:MBL fold metallo-hydrolase [Filimonas lacunae]BAV06269.1 ribonuclease Z [Filimonas lacunae]SIT25569.1 RNAse Z [Filimonas lacunae]